MSYRTSIEWCDATWNPVRGCSRVSEGCRNCYAERVAARFSSTWSPREGERHVGEDRAFTGFAEMTPGGPRWTGRVELVPEKLGEPLRWRAPRRIFVNSMSDLFHESLPDEAIDQVFAVMALAQRHTFLVLTKRPERMRRYLSDANRGGEFTTADKIRIRADEILRERGSKHIVQDLVERSGPLPNVWLGVSVEDQKTADKRIPLLLSTPAAVWFCSYEPALGPVDFHRYVWKHHEDPPRRGPDGVERVIAWAEKGKLDWIIVGGESGPGARPFDVAWARSTIGECKAAGVACFVKQLGACAHDAENGLAGAGLKIEPEAASLVSKRLRDRKGGDLAEWPEDLRVRELLPRAREPAA